MAADRATDAGVVDFSAAIRVPKTSEVIADQIRRKIIKGEIREGDFLPPENAMLSAFSISRPTLREALRILEAEQLISIVRGARTGARVHRPMVEGAARYAGFVLQSEGATIHDVYEARLAIEPFVVRQLASAPKPEIIQDLTSQLARLESLVDVQRYEDFMIGLAEFHHHLVACGGNRTLTLVTRMLQNVVAQHQLNFLKAGRIASDVQRRRAHWGLKSFRKLITLIEHGKVDEAEAHWRLHLSNSNQSWVPASDVGKLIEVV